jgi:hypothetical protein
MSTPFVMHPMLGESGVLYDIDKVSYLGTSYSGGYHVFITRKEAGFDNPEKFRAASGMRIGSQSVGHLIYISGPIVCVSDGPETTLNSSLDIHHPNSMSLSSRVR